MDFSAIPAQSTVFIDANVFIYNFAPDPTFGPPCRLLLERIEVGEITGVTSAAVLHDVAHRLMSLEACAVLEWPHTGIAQRLRRHPQEVQRLHRFQTALEAIGVRVVSVEATQSAQPAE